MKIQRNSEAIRIGNHIFRASDISEVHISQSGRGDLLWIYRGSDTPVSIPIDGDKEEIMAQLLEALS